MSNNNNVLYCNSAGHSENSSSENYPILEQKAKMAADFLFETGISASEGGVHAGFDFKKNAYLFIYNEITGYSVSCALDCYRLWANTAYLNCAKRNVDYLIRQANISGNQFNGFPQGVEVTGGRPICRYYSFDSSIILQSLCDYYTFCGSDDILVVIRQISAWLLNKMQTSRCSFFSFIDEKGDYIHEGDDFYFDESCIHAKIAIGLFKAYAITGDPRLAEAAIKVCRWVLSLRDPETGAFYSNRKKNHIFAHAHCYALEALLYVHGITFDPDLLEAAVYGAHYLAQIQTPEGSIIRLPLDHCNIKRRLFASLHRNETAVDATAQAVRIWLLVDVFQKISSFSENINNAVAWLIKKQITGTSIPRIHGAFFHSPRLKTPTVYTWHTQFSLSALLWLHKKIISRFDVSDMLKGLF